MSHPKVSLPVCFLIDKVLISFSFSYTLCYVLWVVVCVPSYLVVLIHPEPINPEAWRWYHQHVGKGKCTIADTYWQTETGGHIGTNFPGLIPMKPGSCALPCPGIEFAVMDPVSGKEIEGNEIEGVLCIKRSWPSMARTVYGDHDR